MLDPKKVLAVTFTRVAAEDLHRELQKLDVPGCEDLERQASRRATRMRLVKRRALAVKPIRASALQLLPGPGRRSRPSD